MGLGDWFRRKRTEAKFGKMGPGHLMTEDTKRQGHRSSQPVAVAVKTDDSVEAQGRAAAAALARRSQVGAPRPTPRPVSVVPATRPVSGVDQAPAGIRVVSPLQTLDGVYFTCPLMGPEVLPREQLRSKIEDFLLQQMEAEPVMSAALIIHTLNAEQSRVDSCIEFIGKYLENIMAHPGEEKYSRIRLGNKVVAEKILPVKGAEEFLIGAGFRRERSAPAEGQELEDFLVLQEGVRLEDMTASLEILRLAEPIRPELDRGLRVFHVIGRVEQFPTLPEEFYTISREELKKEHEARTEMAEKMGVLRTKAMKERDEARAKYKYRFTLLRFRFPNDVLLQAVFWATETIEQVKSVLTEWLELDYLPFTLHAAGRIVTEETKTLAELNLSPASLLTFHYDADILSELQSSGKQPNFIKPELLAAAIQL